MDVRWLQRSLVRIVFAGMALLLGLPILYSGFQRYRLTREGRTIRARVVAKNVRASTGSRSGTTYRYEVTYVFTTPRGQVVEGAGTVDIPFWNSLKPGAPIIVAYVPDDPGLNAIGDVPGTEGLIISAFAMIFGMPLTAWGTWRLFRVWQERHTELRLLRDGTQAEATIERLDVTPSNLPSCYIHYSYTDHLGQTHHAMTSGFYRGEVAGLMPGDKGSVRFNPERPGQSVWVEGAAIVHAPLAQAPEIAEAVTAPKKRGGPSGLFSGLLLMIAGGCLIYFFIAPRWQAGRVNLGADPIALLAVCIAGVILPVGYLTTLYGAISGGKPPKLARGVVALAVAALFIVGGGGAIAYYGKAYGPSGKLEGLTAALPMLSAFGALMFGFSLAGVAAVYLVVSAVSPRR